MDRRETLHLEHQRRRWMRHDWKRWSTPAFAGEGASRSASTKSYEPSEQKRRAVEFVTDIQLEALCRLRWLVKDIKVDLALRLLGHKYRPDQPRVPAGSREGGQWTDSGGGVGRNDPRVLSDATPDNFFKPGTRLAGDPPGIGHNQGPPIEEPPVIPKQKLPTARLQNTFVKQAARWVLRAGRLGTPTGAFLTGLDAMLNAETDIARIASYQDPPKTLDELREGALIDRPGYDKHHIVEQTPAENDGFPRKMINSPDNIASVPTLKHWEINGWFSRPNEDFGGLSPRDYLRGKDWDERTKVGLSALRKYEVLKP